MSKRDSFAVVGAALREAIATTLANDPPASVTRVLLALIHEVPSWSRLTDNVTRHEVAKLTGLSERQVTRAVHWLASRDIVWWKSGSSTPAGGRISSRVTFFEATGDIAVSPVTPESPTGDKALSSTGDKALSSTGDKALSHYREGFRVVERGNRTDVVAPDGASIGTRRKSGAVAARPAPPADEVAASAIVIEERILATCAKGSWPGDTIDSCAVAELALELAELSWHDIDLLLAGFDRVYGVQAEGESTGPSELIDFIEMGDDEECEEVTDAVRAWYDGFSGTELYRTITAPPVDKDEAVQRLRALSAQVKHA